MRKRNCRVQVRLDNKEYQGFMKAVRKSGLSQEVYLRHLINGVVPQDAPPPDYYHFMRAARRGQQPKPDRPESPCAGRH